MIQLAILAMIASLFLTAVGAPGNWIMIAILGALTWSGRVSVLTLAACIAVAVIAEGIEFMLVKKLAERYGGSRRAFWGALLGGIAGVVVGLPVPVIGSIIAGLLGSFAGAAIATYSEVRDMGQAGRVGWGAMMGRMWAAVAKTAAGVIILVAAIAAVLYR
jgi:uncharacterized protein YqgC (DUF456 family)